MFDPPPGGFPQGPPEHESRVESHRESIDHQPPLRRTSHSYVPARPSRLSNSMTPSAGDVSSSSGDVSGSVVRLASPEVGDEGRSTQEDQPQQRIEEDAYDSASESSASSAEDQDHAYAHPSGSRPPIRRFSGEPHSMRDVEFTFTPSPIRKRPSAQTLRTHSSRSSSHSPATGTGRGEEKPPFKLFQRHVDAEGWDSVRSRELIAGLVVGGTPLRDLVDGHHHHQSGQGVGTPSPRTGYVRGLRSRVDSGVSRGTSTRGRHGLLAKQWSTSSGSGGGDSTSGEGDTEERSAKRIRLSESAGEGSEEQEWRADGEDETGQEDEGERRGEGYSASGSEDAVDQRSFTASLNASHSRINRSADHASRRDAFPVEVSSASEATSEAPKEQAIGGGKRTSWGEKGQELLDRIRDVGTDKSDSWNSWSRSSPGVEEKSYGMFIAAQAR